MTRADVMKLFPDATEEQITSLLNQYNSDIKAKTDKAKDDSEKVKELQSQLDALNEQNMTELEKLQKQVEQLVQSNAKKDDEIASMVLTNQLATIGIVGDSAKALFNEDGKLNVESLGQVISDREKAAVSNFEKQNLNNTPSKQGVSGGTGEDKPDDVKNAESITFGGIADNAQQTRDFYK